MGGRGGGGVDVRFDHVCFSYPAAPSPPRSARAKKKKDKKGKRGSGEEGASGSSQAGSGEAGREGEGEGEQEERAPPHARGVLRDVSFHVPAGSTTALVGSTGSGKSSILRLLLRFYDAESGSVSVDRFEVGTVTQASLRPNIAVVPQDVALFNDTLEHNINYGSLTIGNPSASRENMVRVASAAALHRHVQERLPDQYQTVVGERGLRLSGGEKQRVGLARCLLKDAPILLLDEATSALDSVTEAQVMRSLRGTGRTIIIVAHRLSSVVHADQILVLADGAIVDRGTHEELASRPGPYLEMWRRQSSTQMLRRRV